MIRPSALLLVLFALPGTLSAQETISILDAETSAPIAEGTALLEPARFPIAHRLFDPPAPTPVSFTNGALTLPDSDEPWSIQVDAPGYISFRGNLQHSSSTIWLDRGVNLTLEVRDPSGQPINDARIVVTVDVVAHQGRAQLQAMGAQYSYRTDSSGQVSVTVPDATCGIQVWKNGWAPAAELIPSPATVADRPISLVLKTPELIPARVTDTVTRRPIAGATLTVSFRAPVGHPHEWVRHYSGRSRVVSDAAGVALIPAPPRTEIQQLHFRHDSATLISWEPGEEIEVLAISRPLLRGQLISSSGDPLPREGQLRQARRPTRTQVAATFSIAADGSFEIPAFDPPRGTEDEFSGWIQVRGYERLPIRWDPGPAEVSLGTLTLRRGAPLEVFVEDADGHPAANVRVRLSEGTGTRAHDVIDVQKTDARGVARVHGHTDLPNARLRTEHPDHMTGRAQLKGHESRVTISLGALPTEPLGILRGRVIDDAGQPVAGVAVDPKLAPLFGGPRKFSTRSRADGSFLFEDFPLERLLNLTFSKFGYAPTTLEVTTEANELNLEPVKLSLRCAIEGVVIDSLGSPVAGAQVTIKSTAPVSETIYRENRISRTPDRKLITDREGRFSAQVDWTESQIDATARGLPRTERQTITASPGSVTTITLQFSETLAEAADYTVQVLDEESLPVLGAKLRLTRSSVTQAISLTATTDDEGFATFTEVAPGSWRLAASCAGFLPFQGELSFRDDLAPTLTLSRGAILELAISTDEGVELPTEVRLEEPRYGTLPTPRGLSRPEVIDGIVTISGCTAGEYPFRVWAKDFDISDEHVAVLRDGERTRIEVYLSSEYRPIEFFVDDETGAPVAGATLTISNGSDVYYGSIETNEEGFATYPRTLPYRLEVAVDAPIGFIDRVIKNFTELEENRRIEITLARGGGVILQVFEPDGSPAVRSICRDVSADAEGRIVLDDLPLGTQHLVIYRPGKPLGRAFPGRVAKEDLLGQVTVEVTRGELSNAEFRISPVRHLRGHAWLDGEPLPHGEIQTPFGVATVGPDGSFEAPVRGYGVFTFTRNAENASFTAEVEVAEKENDPIHLRLVRSELRGRIVDRDGNPVPELELELRSGRGALPPTRDSFSTVTDTDGKFRFAEVPSGDHVLVVSNHQEWFPHRWSLSLPEEESLERVASRFETVTFKTETGFTFSSVLTAEGPISSTSVDQSRLIPEMKNRWVLSAAIEIASPSNQMAWEMGSIPDESSRWQPACEVWVRRDSLRTELTYLPQFETRWPGAEVPHHAGHIRSVPRGAYLIRLRRGDQVREFSLTVHPLERCVIDIDSYFWRGVSPGGTPEED